MEPMKEIRIEKVTLNIGVGKATDKLEKGIKLLKAISKMEPVKTFAKKRIPSWGLRPGLPIGCKVTLRGERAKAIVLQLLNAVDNELTEQQFNDGNVSFGIREYIDIPGVKYDPEIGIMGLQCCITLERPGFRVARRKIKKSKIPVRHRISKAESIEFMKKEFGVKLKEVASLK